MNCSLPSLFRIGLLFALVLSTRELTAQESKDVQPTAVTTEQLLAVPDLADLIPLATSLSGRLTSLNHAIARRVDHSQIEKQLVEISSLVDEYTPQLPALKASIGQQAGRLLALTAKINSTGGRLAEINKALTKEVRVFGTLRKEWLTEQKQWDAWRTTLLKDEPLSEISTIVTKAQETIDTALGLLQRELKPLLALQEQAGSLQIRMNVLVASAAELRARFFTESIGDASPSIISAAYVSQLATAIRNDDQTGLVHVSRPSSSFWAGQGWITILQGMVSLVLTLVFFYHRPQLERVKRWRFIATRPLAAGLFIGVLTGVVFYQHPPAVVTFTMTALGGGAFVRLLAGLVEAGWRRQCGYGLVALVFITDLFYAFGLPIPLFRLYIVVTTLVGFVSCLRWVALSRSRIDAPQHVWALWTGVVVFAAVLLVELWGAAELAEFLFVSSLRTLAIVIVFSLLRRFVREGLAWIMLRSSSYSIALVGRRNAAVLAQRLALFSDALIILVILAGLLGVWHVYDNPTKAILSLLALQARVGAQSLTVGLVVAALALFSLFYLVSWILQQVLTEHMRTRRQVDAGASLSVARLVHYALVTIGFMIALTVLGVDLSKMTLLASALGVGIGFGLQTVVNNFVCGLILLFERPLRVGDTIEFGGTLAKIAKIGLRSTTLRTSERADVIVPNTNLITNQVTNWTLTDRLTRGIIPVSVAFGSDVPLVMQTLRECALAHPRVMESPAPQVLFRSFGDTALNFELQAWVADIDDRTQVESDLLEEIDRRFRKAGVQNKHPTCMVCRGFSCPQMQPE